VLRITLVGLAGLAGTLCRYWLSGAVVRRYGEEFPWGTLAVNVAGCFAVGLLYQLLQERGDVGETARAAVFVGLLGGFTTFSSFSLQTLDLARDGRWGLAAANIVLSVLICLAAVALGHGMAHLLND